MTSVYAFATKLQTIQNSKETEKERIVAKKDKIGMKDVSSQWVRETKGMDKNSPTVLQLEERLEKLQEMEDACDVRIGELEERSKDINELSQACDKN